MKYTIISIDDSRQKYKDNIRQVVDGEEVFIPATDGTVVGLEKELNKRNLKVNAHGLMLGEIGVWLSVFDCWEWAVENGELTTFEDDAIPTEEFNNLLKLYKQELWEDFDFCSLWVPENQLIDYIYNVEFDDVGSPTHVGDHKSVATSVFNVGAMRIARVYQGYGNVAMHYSAAGAQKLIDEVRRQGICEPVDCFIFKQSHTNRVLGFAPKPQWAKAVSYDWEAMTTVHDSGRHITLELGPALGIEYGDALEHALRLRPTGHALEFGVATGHTLKTIAARMSATGFDSFAGLPENWRTGFPAGFFAQSPPDVPEAEIVVGLFEDSLPKWIINNPDKLSDLGLVHIDCDLYSSTVTILDNIGRYLKSGTLIVFDEYHGYPGWEEHEYKAWQEFVEESGIEYDMLGHGPEQLVVRIK